jgi:hypothetical protein
VGRRRSVDVFSISVFCVKGVLGRAISCGADAWQRAARSRDQDKQTMMTIM